MSARASGLSRDGRFVLLVFLLALALRLAPFPDATARGWRLLSPDCYGHLRRSVSVARNFPRVPVRDAYLNHPDGGVFIWPPAFDFVAGGVSRALYGRAATTEQVLRVAALLPAVLGALHVLPLFAFARRTLGRRRARIATAAYTMIPAAVLWGGFGHFDHHVAEALNLLLVLAAGAWTAAARGGARFVRAGVLGATIALAVLTWQGAVFVAGLAFLWAALALGEAAAVTCVVATALVALGAAATLPAEPVPFSFVSFGWFQPLLLAGAAAPLLGLAAWRAEVARRRALWVLFAAVALAVALPNAQRVLTAVFHGGAYVFKEGAGESANDFANGGFLSYPPEFLRLVAECQPLIQGARSLERALRELSPGFLLVPLAALLWARAGVLRPRGSRARGRLLLALFAAAVFAMSLFQQRNVYYLAIFTALALAEACARVGARARSFPKTALPFLLAAGLVIVPGWSYLQRARAFADGPGYDVLDLFARLRALDPPAVDPAAVPQQAPGTIPGVMPPWSMGHFVTALAERPAAADPFVYGWRRQCRLFTATDDAEALAILRAAKCRYLVTTELSPLLPAYAAAAGRAPAPTRAMFARRVHESDVARPLPFLERVLDSRTGTRRADGTFQPRFRVFRVLGADAP
ncbi:MAG TPA: STT3 domain-containing protein [Thermoanaerobaculia bacterium]